MTRQCLSRRIDDISILRRALSVRKVKRNTVAAKLKTIDTVHWYEIKRRQW